ncbi:MAG: hypothetical protein A3G83_02355 [Betaproteobacteria bacterium RIFCSPLOWO2_12_FULL_68_20]|nr:MAG: hypothetical protein A3G83_02355 [Betaproteobacteria bacterium RIFCSPLOWO2_12_FULL_68_20]
MTALLCLELNELNFEFVEHYARRGELPQFGRLIAAHGYSRTRSEAAYEHIEPWIQWLTVHTGKAYAEHKVFRLGDGPQAGLRQIWEELASKGLKVGAFSPMNAANAVADAAFFVPDPWTRTSVAAPALMRAAYQAICQAVGDNAQGRVTPLSALELALGLAAYARPAHWGEYFELGFAGLRNHWPRAVFLDRFLADCFVRLWRRTRPDFATLFLNGAAHLQHHYLFNSAAYRGPYRNPAWYLPPAVDPVLEIYRLYDRIVGECLALEPRPRVMLATGLHQDAMDEPAFYWRLRDHGAFLRAIGCDFERVEPRMSRDFLVACKDAAQARHSAARLASGRAPDGAALFEVDNRGDTLFVMLTYPREIAPGFAARFEGAAVDDLSREVVFVALKNGQHNGVGYFLDTGARASPAAEPIPLAELWQRMVSAF